jgi:hypothetical protein
VQVVVDAEAGDPVAADLRAGSFATSLSPMKKPGDDFIPRGA